MRPSAYGDPDPIARELLEDGRRWSILPGPVAITAPVAILQGAADPEFPGATPWTSPWPSGWTIWSSP
jgi:hypothetical protein